MERNKLLANLNANISPDIEMYKIGPEVITEFIGKFVISLGGSPNDIKSVTITDDKKKLRILFTVEKGSVIFKGQAAPVSRLSMLGTASTPEGELSEIAINTLRELGFRYKSLEKGKEVAMYEVEKGKKNCDIELDSEIVMAIITNSDYLDEYLFIDASEEVVHKKDYDKKKFKSKKSMVTFAKVQRTCNNKGYDPAQVYERNNGLFKSQASDEEDDD